MKPVLTSSFASALIERTWYGERAAPLLQPAAWGFRGASGFRNGLYDRGLLRQVRLEVPVISVGNLVAGGAGKTPVVIALAQRFIARGKRVAVLSRGYGGSPTGHRVNDGRRMLQTARECGDEPWLIARRVPEALVLVGANRVQAAREAVARGAQVVVLDDGFQHRALARDEDILVFGGRAPLGNRQLIPAGPLREPPGSMRRATLAWLNNGAELGALDGALPPRRICSRYRAIDVVDTALAISHGLGALKSRRVWVVAGIARPAPFVEMVKELGAEVAGGALFDDHHRFTRGELERLAERAARLGAEMIVTTEKDAARLAEGQSAVPIRAVRIDVQIIEGERVIEELVNRC